MGLFGFGRNKHKAKDESKEDVSEDVVSEGAVEDGADEGAGEPVRPGDGVRGETEGPWDVDDEYVPDYDDYLDIGALFLPYMQGIALRLKADRRSNQVLGANVSLGGASLELEAFAAPKSSGLWDDVRADLLAANPDAEEVDGTFGKELRLPVKVAGGRRTVITRVVGVDGPRWMLRGIFTGAAVDAGEIRDRFDRYFSSVVVERGDEPLAPRDMIPMHAPITPAQRRKLEESQNRDDDESADLPGKPKGPLTPLQERETQTTLRRGPLFSEVR